MEIEVLIAVVFAALLHAVWNALVKAQSDKLLSMAAIVFGGAFWAGVTLLFVALPQRESWLLLAVGAGLHLCYNLFLQAAYKYGDLSLVYPISRGVAPLIVTVFSVFILDVELGWFALIGIGFVIFAVICIIFSRNNSGKFEFKALILALITAIFIASYSLVDGIGVRLADSPFGFYACLTILGAVGFSVFIGFMQPRIFKQLVTGKKSLALLAGGASYLAFSIVIWAFTQAPIALVTALRETSIIFAMLIGVFVFKENFGVLKKLAVAAIIVGAVLLRV